MWVRGLKPALSLNTHVVEQSHPMWVRGLKLLLVMYASLYVRRTLCGCVD